MALKKKFIKSKNICRVTFSLPLEAAKLAKWVSIVGDFNNWNWRTGIPMELKRKTFKADVDLEIGKSYQFRYLINKRTWENDWEADDYIPTEFGVDNCIVNTFLEEE